jgi:hypothetical protein
LFLPVPVNCNPTLWHRHDRTRKFWLREVSFLFHAALHFARVQQIIFASNSMNEGVCLSAPFAEVGKGHEFGDSDLSQRNCAQNVGESCERSFERDQIVTRGDQNAGPAGNGAPRSMKMGTIDDGAARHALQSASLRRPAILHYAGFPISPGGPVTLR